MKLKSIYQSILSLLLCASSLLFSSEEVKNTEVFTLLTSTEISKTTPLQGRYMFIARNAFFFEGKVLSKEEFLKAIEGANKIKGKKAIVLHYLRECSAEDFIAIREELYNKNFIVVSDSHGVDLNDLYRGLVEENEKIEQRSK